MTEAAPPNRRPKGQRSVEPVRAGLSLAESEGLPRETLPLYAGAMHYWRHPPEEWGPGLDAIKSLGLRVVDTYVPWAAHELDDASRSSLVTQFDLVTVQRKLKDAGRFVFIDRKKQNSGFLRFVEPTNEKVRSSLGRLAPSDVDMAELAGILDRALASAPVASTALASDPER